MMMPSQFHGIRDWAHQMWIRADWLENLGLGVPSTIDEFTDVMRAFSHNDPTGTGQETFAKGIRSGNFALSDWGSLITFFEMFGVQPGWWFNGMLVYEDMPDGSVRFSGSNLPAMHEALRLLQYMHAEGLIPPDWTTVSDTRFTEDIATSTTGIISGAWWVAGWPMQGNRNENPDMDWVAIPPPSRDGTPHHVNVFNPSTRWYAVSANATNPEVVVMMANLFTDVQFGPNHDQSDPRRHRVEGIPGAPPNTGRGPVISPVRMVVPRVTEMDFRAINHALRTGDSSALVDAQVLSFDRAVGFRDGHDDPEVNPQTGWADYWSNSGLPNTINHTIFDRMAHFELRPNAHMGVITDSMASYLALYQSLALEALVRIVTGQEDVYHWDAMIEQWDALGNQAIIAEIMELRGN